MEVENASGKGPQDRLAQDPQKTGADNEVDAQGAESVGQFLQGRIGEATAPLRAWIEEEGGNVVFFGDLENARTGIVGNDNSDLATEPALLCRCEDGTRIGSLSGTKNGDTAECGGPDSGRCGEIPRGERGTGRLAWDESENTNFHSELIEEGLLLIDERLRSVVAAFGVDVGANRVDHSGGATLFEDDDGIDTAQRPEHLGTFDGSVDGASGALQFAHGGVAIDRDDEGVTESPRLGEVARVADVKNIENSVCEDQFPAFPRELLPQGGDLVQTGDKRLRHTGKETAFSAFHNPLFP